jgi:hypothetical protein
MYFSYNPLRWYRTSSAHEEGIQIDDATSHEYILTQNDVGYLIRVVYTPVRADGVEGNPITVTSSEPVNAGSFLTIQLFALLSFMLPITVLPRVSDIILSGTLMEGETLEAQYRVTGGHDGQNSLKWFRGTQKEEGVTIWEDISYSD